VTIKCVFLQLISQDGAVSMTNYKIINLTIA